MKCTCVQYRKTKDGTAWQSYPCGQCMACRLNKVRDWTLRIMHEARFHTDSVFLTLTYSPDKLPLNGSLDKEDVQDFMKRLRYYVGKVRFFLCGEYGDRYKRPHYHLILFGIGKDHPIFKGKHYDPRKKGYFMDNFKPWDKGICFLGDVTYSSARYVASYVNKKQLGKKGKSFYEENNLTPEFILMSRRPGIGQSFVDFTNPSFSDRNLFTGKGGKWLCPGSMKTRCLIRQNLKQREQEKKLNIQKLVKVILVLCNVRKI